MSGIFSLRDALWWLVFTGLIFNFMMQMSLNIAIVSMVQRKPMSLTNITKLSNYINYNENESSAQFEPSINLTIENSINYFVNDTKSGENIKLHETTLKKYRYDWDEYKQNLVLGAFYWFHWVTQIPGGVLAQRYGTKIVFGLSNLFLCLTCMLIPVSAELDYRALIAVRIAQGLISGVSLPSLQVLTANWVPPNERSRFVTSYLGASFGNAVTYPLCGLLIDLLDWPEAIFITSSLGLLWFIVWWIVVQDSPDKHPWISKKEKQHILSKLAGTVSKVKLPTPWMKILCSGPVWIYTIAKWGSFWSFYILNNQTPTYFKRILNWDIRATGLLSGLPNVFRFIFTYIFSTIIDFLLTKELISRTNGRKLEICLGCFGQAIFYIFLSFLGSEYIMAIVFVTLAITINGASITGLAASSIDLSPNFVSVIQGASNVICVTSGIISPLVVGTLTLNNQTEEQWRIVFLISTAILLTTSTIYLFFASSEIQEWNSPVKPEIVVEELKLINGTEFQVEIKHNSNVNESTKQEVSST